MLTMWATRLGLACLLPSLVLGSVGLNETQDVFFDPPNLIHMIEGTNHEVTWSTMLPDVDRVTAHVADEMVAKVTVASDVARGAPDDNATHYGLLNVSALFIGYNDLHVTLYDQQDEVVGTGKLEMSVLLSYQKLSQIFIMCISVFVGLVYINMGATMDLKIVKNITKKPVGPLLGITCQYLFMPLIAFALGKLAFPGNVLGQLGMFLTGCCPGGGASNMWTHLLEGSLDLSIMMTFFSTLCAFVALPLWVYLMGPIILGDADFVIPYKDIAILVISLALPCIVGLLIQKFLPRVAKALTWLLTPMSIFIIIFTFTFGVYSNLYVFSFFDAKTLLVGFALPSLGYLSGFLLAKIFRQPLADVIAISVETGIQNASVAVIIVKFTLEKPAGDLTVVFPAASTIMTPLPLLVILLSRKIYAYVNKSKSADIATLEGKAGVETEKEIKENKQQTESNGQAMKSPKEEGGVDNLGAQLQDEAF